MAGWTAHVWWGPLVERWMWALFPSFFCVAGNHVEYVGPTYFGFCESAGGKGGWMSDVVAAVGGLGPDELLGALSQLMTPNTAHIWKEPQT